MGNPRVAYIGLDHLHCEAYLQSLGEMPVELTCACEPNEAFDDDSLDDLGDVPVYRDVWTLFDAESVDIAWVSVSNERTPAVIKLAARHGVDVYAEKPLARTAEDLDSVIETVDSMPITVVAGYQNRGAAPAKRLRALVSDGFFGEMRAVELRMITSQLRYRDVTRDLYDAAASRGGILQWLGCHYIDIVQWIVDEPIVRVNAQVSHGTDGVDVDDGASLQFELSSGAMGTLVAGYYDREYDLYVGLHGTAGRATWDPTAEGPETDLVEYESYGDRWTDSTRRVEHVYDSVPGYGGAIGHDYMTAFLDARTGDRAARDYVATVDDALGVLRVLDAAYQSAETGEWCEVG